MAEFPPWALFLGPQKQSYEETDNEDCDCYPKHTFDNTQHSAAPKQQHNENTREKEDN
jgi:hypothetical protein